MVAVTGRDTQGAVGFCQPARGTLGPQKEQRFQERESNYPNVLWQERGDEDKMFSVQYLCQTQSIFEDSGGGVSPSNTCSDPGDHGTQ